MSAARWSMRATATFPSARASGAPGQVCAPWPNDRCWRALARSTTKSSGSSNRAGSRLAAPLTTINVVPAGTSTPPTEVGTRDRRKSPFTGLSMRSASSTKLGMRSGWSRSCCWSSGRSARYWNAVPNSRTVVSCPAANRLAATRTTSMTSGVDPSGKVASARPVSTSSRGFARRSSTYSPNRS